jgi:hypothetical protein
LIDDVNFELWFVVGGVHVIVVGDNITIPCEIPVNSESWPIWLFIPTNQTGLVLDHAIIHNGLKDTSPRPAAHFAVDVTGNFSYLTLMNASADHAGTYRCLMAGTEDKQSEVEIIVIGKFFVLLQTRISKLVKLCII